MSDKVSTIKVKESTKAMLEPYRVAYGSYEKGIIELINEYEKIN